jgi:hypothetical protein
MANFWFTDHVVNLNGFAAAQSPISVIASLAEPDADGVAADQDCAGPGPRRGDVSPIDHDVGADVNAIYRTALELALDVMPSVLAESETDRWATPG